jgi:pimeloyl-ACP methyl ester carboxylesterase
MAHKRTADGRWSVVAGLIVGAAMVVLSGCRGHEEASRGAGEQAHASRDPGATAATSATAASRATAARGATAATETTSPLSAPPSAPPTPAAPARVERIRVPGDVAASVVRASDGAPPTTVFLPGLCSNANAYLHAFPEAARRQGGVFAIEGDQPCGALEGFRSFSWDASKLHARIEAAAAAAGLTAVPREGLTLVGYSQGAALGEQLVQRWPSRYARVVLIGAPTDPSASKLAEARAVVTMSCARDVPWKMKEATSRFVRAGIPSTYLEMPGCTHGNIADGDVTFDAAFDWLRTNARPIRDEAKAQPLVGALAAEG